MLMQQLDHQGLSSLAKPFSNYRTCLILVFETTSPTLICFVREKCVPFFLKISKIFFFPLFKGMICGFMEGAKISLLHSVISHYFWKYSNWGYQTFVFYLLGLTPFATNC